MQHAGCVLIGAADEGEEDLVGFVLGFGGFSEGPHLHSHMLATLPERQSGGVGYALKLAQRAAALEAGLDEIRWTYDPLLARNAWFNLMKLGAAGKAFLPDFYGEMTDLLNAGDRSGRHGRSRRRRGRRPRSPRPAIPLPSWRPPVTPSLPFPSRPAARRRRGRPWPSRPTTWLCAAPIRPSGCAGGKRPAGPSRPASTPAWSLWPYRAPVTIVSKMVR